ncbi:hypothetical protein K457DRAFT_15280 [Linnemannia elongata AG-77]|uniref:Uncharacterized protein n=1 Tax=Linnemannia elongata AG-77 TaxID=1314771 RepID=A0A197K8R8_9FUNG|nr:hypothetical protein K457DRAFT_15280 [Linnemannia elongata AG-77]
MQKDLADQSGICPPGTVSHVGLIRTSTPAQCYVLCNENRFHVGQFPETGRHTVLLCARCTRSVVMVPAAF